MNDQEILFELTPVVEQLLERHLETSKEWFPHELVPHGRGRDIEPGHEWSEADADLAGHELSAEVRSALYVNLLTEDNLPYYFRTVESLFGADGPWGTWVRRWTAEEGRHSMVIYGYLAATRAIDLAHLERGRMAQVSLGETPAPESLHDGFVYLALQELATRISHRNTGLQMGDPVGYEVMKRVGSDENLHQLFYRDLAAAAVEVDPNEMMIAMERQVRNFAMPGTGHPRFRSTFAADREGRYLRPPDPPRADPRPGRVAAMGRVQHRWTVRRGRCRAGEADEADGDERARRQALCREARQGAVAPTRLTPAVRHGRRRAERLASSGDVSRRNCRRVRRR